MVTAWIVPPRTAKPGARNQKMRGDSSNKPQVTPKSFNRTYHPWWEGGVISFSTKLYRPKNDLYFVEFISCYWCLPLNNGLSNVPAITSDLNKQNLLAFSWPVRCTSIYRGTSARDLDQDFLFSSAKIACSCFSASESDSLVDSLNEVTTRTNHCAFGHYFPALPIYQNHE